MSAAPVPMSVPRFDRAGHHRADEQWLAQAWRRSRVVLLTPDSAVPVIDDRVDYRTAESAPSGVRRFLGVADGVPYFSVTTAGEDSWQTLRQFGARTDELAASLVVAAIGLEQWHQRNPFCPHCGSASVEAQAGWTRTCTDEGRELFPRTDPAVIMLVHDGERALLGRGPRWGPGRFSTLAGFVEPGESAEAAVAREVGEEVGVAITDIRYVGSQPWPFPASLMLGFTARLAGPADLTLDPAEMLEAGWFTRAEVARAADWVDGDQPMTGAGPRLVGIPPRLSISRYLIDDWLTGGR